MLIEKIKQRITAELSLHRTVKEYDLISLLRQEITAYALAPLAEQMELFRCHFLLRHALYQLRNEWRLATASELFISALYIENRAWQAGEIGLQKYDRLADFYLDLNNLETITEQEISLLINGFWNQFLQNNARKRLCELLGLATEIDDENLKKCWRKAILRLHPDKGGDSEQFKQVQSAYDNWRKPQNAN